MGATRTRLLVICHGFPPYYGGAEHAAWYLAREAARSGADAHVLTSDIGGRLPAEERMGDLTLHRVPSPKKEWTRHTVRELVGFYLAARGHLDRLQARVHPDFILAHFSVPAGLLALQWRRRHGTAYAVVLHGSDVPGYQPGRFGWVYPLLRPVVRRVWQQADQVIAVSESLRELALRTWPGGRIALIENGVDTEAFHPRPGSESRSPPLQVVVVSQLIERKGLAYLLRALAGMPEPERERMVVNIYGTGPRQTELEALAGRLHIQDHVFFRGLVKHEDLPDILRQSDVFVLPSLQEGVPLALLDAMATGLAIIATPVGGIPQVLRHDQNALLVAPGEVAPLQDALRRVMDESLRARLGAAARRAAENYGWPAVWRKYAKTCGLPGI